MDCYQFILDSGHAAQAICASNLPLQGVIDAFDAGCASTGIDLLEAFNCIAGNYVEEDRGSDVFLRLERAGLYNPKGPPADDLDLLRWYCALARLGNPALELELAYLPVVSAIF
jgi:hypothetical protein